MSGKNKKPAETLKNFDKLLDTVLSILTKLDLDFGRTIVPLKIEPVKNR